MFTAADSATDDSEAGRTPDVPLSDGGKRDLYSSPEPSGPFKVECERCGALSRIGLLELAVCQLPVGYWLPRGKFDRRMTCPACDHRVWASVTLRH